MRIDPESPKTSDSLRGLEKFRKPEDVKETAEDIGDVVLSPVTGDPKGVLRGLEKFPSHSTPEGEESHEVAVGTKVIHRDSGLTFEVESISEERSGPLAHLIVRDESGKKVRQENLRPDDLRQKLETPDGPWSWA
ncbi:MAG: hypothetical protein ACREGG_02670 [Candidatus Saccharimonadales bacterium]